MVAAIGLSLDNQLSKRTTEAHGLWIVEQESIGTLLSRCALNTSSSTMACGCAYIVDLIKLSINGCAYIFRLIMCHKSKTIHIYHAHLTPRGTKFDWNYGKRWCVIGEKRTRAIAHLQTHSHAEKQWNRTCFQSIVCHHLNTNGPPIKT